MLRRLVAAPEAELAAWALLKDSGRWQEIPDDETFYLLCDTGPRSYEAQVFLRSRGLDNTRNIQGGFAMIRAIDPGFI